MNDALKEKDYTSNELVTAVDVAWDIYGKDNGLLVVAKKQNRVLLNRGGISIAAAIAAGKMFPNSFLTGQWSTQMVLKDQGSQCVAEW